MQHSYVETPSIRSHDTAGLQRTAGAGAHRRAGAESRSRLDLRRFVGSGVLRFTEGELGAERFEGVEPGTSQDPVAVTTNRIEVDERMNRGHIRSGAHDGLLRTQR